MRFNDNVTIKELFDYTELIKKNGDLFFLKIDGEREENHLTIIISFPPGKNKEQIRFDGHELESLLRKALGSYFS